MTPPNIEISQESLDIIIKKINTKKGNGLDYIPLSLLKLKGGKELIRSVVNEALKQSNPNSKLFATRLVLLSKSGSNFPKITEIRPIAVITVTQKI